MIAFINYLASASALYPLSAKFDSMQIGWWKHTYVCLHKLVQDWFCLKCTMDANNDSHNFRTIHQACAYTTGYSFWLAARVLLYASSHKQDSTYHGLCYTKSWSACWNDWMFYLRMLSTFYIWRMVAYGSTMRNRSDDPLHHEWTLYHGVTSCSSHSMHCEADCHPCVKPLHQEVCLFSLFSVTNQTPLMGFEPWFLLRSPVLCQLS